MSQPQLADHEKYFPIIMYRKKNIGVFWNVEDYPVADGVDPCTIYSNIKETLEEESFEGEVSILAYVDKNKFSEELRDQYRNAGINTDFIPEGTKHAKFISLLQDILFWALKNRAPANLIILSKDMDKDMIYHLETMYSNHYAVILSDTEPGWRLPDGCSDWLVSSLTDGGSPSGESSPGHEADGGSPSGGSSAGHEDKKRKIADSLANSED